MVGWWGYKEQETLPPPHPPSQRRGAKMQTLNKFAVLSLFSLSLAFLGNCGGCGSSGNGGGDSSSAGPTCTENQILKDGSCEACTAPQYPNADRTACVTNCPDGQIKLEDNPACETQVICTGRQIYNPTDNSCFELSCDEGEIPDTTANPPVLHCRDCLP